MALTEANLNLSIDHSVKLLRRSVRNLRAFNNGANRLPKCLVDSPEVELNPNLLNEAKVYSNRLSLLSGLNIDTNGVC